MWALLGQVYRAIGRAYDRTPVITGAKKAIAPSDGVSAPTFTISGFGGETVDGARVKLIGTRDPSARGIDPAGTAMDDSSPAPAQRSRTLAISAGNAGAERGTGDVSKENKHDRHAINSLIQVTSKI